MVDVSDQDWAGLPQDLIHEILNKIVSLQDYIRFGAVSPNWHRITQENWHNRIQVQGNNNHQLPLLLIPTNIDNIRSRRGLYSLSKPGICQTELLVPYSRRCCGSSHGWLITLDVSTSVITLINPFSFKLRYVFPAFMGDIIIIDDGSNSNRFNEYYIHKAVLSATPDSCPCAIAIIYGGGRKLAILQINSNTTTTTPTTSINATTTWNFINGKDYRSFQDIIYYRDRFHALDVRGKVYSCDASGPISVLQIVAPPAPCFLVQQFCKKYIVESPHGELLQVIRLLYAEEGGSYYWTTGFSVSRLVQKSDGSGSLEWVAVDTLSDCALFLGDNHSLFVLASNFPGDKGGRRGGGCIANSIYYTDDGTYAFMMGTPYDVTGAYDIGVYSMEHNTVSLHYVPNPALMHLPPPIWIVPSLR